MKVGLSRMEMGSVRVFRNIFLVLSLIRIRRNLIPVDLTGFCGGCRKLLRIMVYLKKVSPSIVLKV